MAEEKESPILNTVLCILLTLIGLGAMSMYIAYQVFEEGPVGRFKGHDGPKVYDLNDED